MATDKIAAIGRTALFTNLSAEALRALASRAVERSFGKG
jgi:hypothetical protein